MSGKAIVAHHYWARPGGAEVVTAATSRTFMDLKYDVVAVSMTKFDTSKYIEWFGLNLDGLRVYSLPIKRLRMFGIYMRLAFTIPLYRAIKRERPDILWIDNDAYKPILKLKRNIGFKLIEYIHYPFTALWHDKFRNTRFHWKNDPYFRERYGRFPWNIYFGVWVALHKRLVRDNPFEAADLVLVNSRWTGRLVRELFGEDPVVLNPPLPPATKIAERPRPFEEREPMVVMLGRYSHEKRYEWVLKNIAPKLQEYNVKLVIIGGTGTKTAEAHYNHISRIKAKLGLKNVELIKNAPRTLINKLLDSARVFLHATINEHFGIVVAEAMARGLPIVVHKSGGAWTDLAGEGVYGLGYEDANEAVEAILRLVEDPKIWRHYSEMGLKRAANLTFDAFKKRMTELLEQIA